MYGVLFAIILLGNSYHLGESYVSPQEYFGDSYTEALRFYDSQKADFEIFFSKYGIDPALASAVVFPEVIRYNRFRDYMETTALEIAYVNGGKSVADFSIGRFQMKPSFVEMLETELQFDDSLGKHFTDLILYPAAPSVQDIRRERINRLKNQQWQQRYLACFVLLAQKKFAKILLSHPNEELLILSSAYNLGLNSSHEAIVKVSLTKSFPYGNPRTGRFSYYDVANYFYTNHSPKIFQRHED